MRSSGADPSDRGGLARRLPGSSTARHPFRSTPSFFPKCAIVVTALTKMQREAETSARRRRRHEQDSGRPLPLRRRALGKRRAVESHHLPPAARRLVDGRRVPLNLVPSAGKIASSGGDKTKF